MMCRSCGAQTNGEARFCTHCGVQYPQVAGLGRVSVALLVLLALFGMPLLLVVVFDRDAPTATQAVHSENASVDQHTGEEVAKLQQAKKQLFAQELQQTLREKGFNIVVITDGSNELVLDSDDIFQNTSTRVMFVNSVLPKWGPVLCRAGFTEVRIRGRGFFEMGQDFPISCY